MDLGTALFACAGISLALALAIAAGVVTARLFFRATRKVEDGNEGRL